MHTAMIKGYVRAADVDGHLRLREHNDRTSSVVFDGCVASGIDTALRAFRDGLQVTVVRERHDIWRVVE